ncbi:STAS domain-containing protein [Ramlibacter sp. AN1015]|uniref:STAS domain-containing protein n=1 Tax=Ramlibacter sp. AN1015 TaxID=3133428 RepID=UPI0030BCB472
MELTNSEHGGVTVIAVKGSIDSLNADQLTRAFARPVAQGQVMLVADFAAVTYTSSAGLRSLLAAVKDCRQHGGDLRIAAPQAQVQRVLSISGFAGIIQIFADREAALDSFRAAA